MRRKRQTPSVRFQITINPNKRPAAKTTPSVGLAPVTTPTPSATTRSPAEARASRGERPNLFRQRRIGRDNHPFDVLKFRTMTHQEPTPGFVLADGLAPGGVEGVDRRTRVGRWLRKASLDELPQLFNVARGEMSLVGPRPERPEYATMFAVDLARYAERHRVRAGITGLSQVHGLRGQCPIADRVELDNYYIENWSPGLDFKILLMTVLAVLKSAE